MKRVNVVSAIMNDEAENILMVKNVKGYWELPGGAVEKGEHLNQAVIREMKEETGFVCKVKELSKAKPQAISLAKIKRRTTSFLSI